MNIRRSILQCAAFILFSVISVPLPASAQGTAFTYQGQLQNNGSPASGTYNLTFTLFTTNTGGAAVAGPVTNNAVTVSNGLFTVLVDFGSGAFTGSSNWLQIAVETNGASSFTTLTPRQQLTPAPYAIFATTAGGTSNLLGTVLLAQLPSAVVTNNENGVTVSNLTLTGALTLPSTGTGPDIIRSSGALLLFGDNNGNFFIGQLAGNTTLTGVDNTGIGVSALSSITNGNYNVANGFVALHSNTSGIGNTANGFEALSKNTSGTGNTANGFEALFSNTNGTFNTADGVDALEFLGANTPGGGTNNIALGYNAGSAFTGNESSNIDIGNAGVIGDNGVIRIGSSQQATYLVGMLNFPAAPLTIYSGGSLLLRADNDNNFFAGPNAGNLTTSGHDNTAYGLLALESNTSGSRNTGNGAGALQFDTSGSENTAEGFGALESVRVGTNNIALGYNAGGAFTGNESSDIDIGNTGVVGDSGVIRIGAEGVQTITLLVGNVGLSEASPASALHITGPTNAPPGALNSGDNGLLLGTTGTSGYKWIQSYGGSLALNPQGNNVGIGNSSPSHLLQVGSGGAYCDGTTWVNGSDRNSKRDFIGVSPREVLEKVSGLPITEWQYKVAPGEEHLGPMAQDFHAAFGLNGGDDKHISTVDEGGVALAAIQGLNQKLNEKDAEIADLKARLETLEQIVLKQKSN